MFGSLNSFNSQRLVERFRQTLLEDNRKDILNYADPRIKARVRNQDIFNRYQGMDQDGRMQWKVKSGTIPGHWWNVWIQFKDMAHAIHIMQEQNPQMLDLRITRALVDGDLECHCDCPCWLYWGMQYYATQRGSVIKPETRAPKRNLAYAGTTACKHIVCALQTLPFLSTTIVGQLRARGKFGDRSSRRVTSNG